MRDVRPDVHHEMNFCISQHWRDGWVLVRRADNPPCARMRKVENPQNLPLGVFVRPMLRSQQINYRDITISADGTVTWHDLPADQTESGEKPPSSQALPSH
jgi:hypothetical protein